MFKNKSYKQKLITLGLLFSGPVVGSQIENIEKECSEVAKDFIEAIKKTKPGSLPNNVKVHSAEFETTTNMKVKTEYTSKEYEVECSKKVDNYMDVTVKIVVSVD
ncbi:hypothetical protein [Kangiella sediminilitoris]|uniref:Uncharacterized protein n=1 Tax=Kangiella sediminilitoris TaxID=1144748 RepID=A0A1B3BDA4_9GAMM|nr:hypothetical protein [Kangiella sediminilitoris]AOE50755.1 hypothetical protein KS2013_2050 [Kangiella sediminilitoris]